jgi:flagellar biosynthesis component FlhA
MTTPRPRDRLLIVGVMTVPAMTVMTPTTAVADALRATSVRTIGAGVVAQLPALLSAIATRLFVMRLADAATTP